MLVVSVQVATLLLLMRRLIDSWPEVPRALTTMVLLPPDELLELEELELLDDEELLELEELDEELDELELLELDDEELLELEDEELDELLELDEEPL
jgi:hypothetical protein